MACGLLKNVSEFLRLEEPGVFGWPLEKLVAAPVFEIGAALHHKLRTTRHNQGTKLRCPSYKWGRDGQWVMRTPMLELRLATQNLDS